MRPQRIRCGNLRGNAGGTVRQRGFNEAAANSLRKLTQPWRNSTTVRCFNEAAANSLRKPFAESKVLGSGPSFNEAAANSLRKHRIDPTFDTTNYVASMRPQRIRCGNSCWG